MLDNLATLPLHIATVMIILIPSIVYALSIILVLGINFITTDCRKSDND